MSSNPSLYLAMLHDAKLLFHVSYHEDIFPYKFLTCCSCIKAVFVRFSFSFVEKMGGYYFSSYINKRNTLKHVNFLLFSRSIIFHLAVHADYSHYPAWSSATTHPHSYPHNVMYSLSEGVMGFYIWVWFWHSLS